MEHVSFWFVIAARNVFASITFAPVHGKGQSQGNFVSGRFAKVTDL
jgi:hypothetical protein